MTQASRRTDAASLDIVIDGETLSLLEQAARIERKPMVELVLDAARRHARAVVEADGQIVVPAEDFARILEELNREPEPSAELQAALKRARASRIPPHA